MKKKYLRTYKKTMIMKMKNPKQILQNKWNSQDNLLMMKGKLKLERLNRLEIKSGLKYN